MRFLDLPVELIEAILANLDTDSKCSVARTARALLPLARTVLFLPCTGSTHVKVYGADDGWLEFFEAGRRSPEAARRLHAIEFSTSGSLKQTMPRLSATVRRRAAAGGLDQVQDSAFPNCTIVRYSLLDSMTFLARQAEHGPMIASLTIAELLDHLADTIPSLSVFETSFDVEIGSRLLRTGPCLRRLDLHRPAGGQYTSFTLDEDLRARDIKLFLSDGVSSQGWRDPTHRQKLANYAEGLHVDNLRATAPLFNLLKVYPNLKYASITWDPVPDSPGHTYGYGAHRFGRLKRLMVTISWTLLERRLQVQHTRAGSPRSAKAFIEDAFARPLTDLVSEGCVPSLELLDIRLNLPQELETAESAPLRELHRFCQSRGITCSAPTSLPIRDPPYEPAARRGFGLF